MERIESKNEVAFQEVIRMSTKRLYKSREKKVCGVCGGIAEYIDIDPTVIRLVWLLTVVCGGCGILAYFLAAIIMDDSPDYVE